MPELEIYVDGQGSVTQTAERGYLRVSIEACGTNQSQAFQEAQSTVATLTSKIRGLTTKTKDGYPHPDAAVTAFTVAPLSTMSLYPRDKNWKELRNLPKEHKISSSAEIIFRNMVQLANVSNELATMPHVSIIGTEWRLTEATREKIQREARIKAMKDAVQKAQDYAEVVGRQVVVVEIKDDPSPAAQSSPHSNRAHQQTQMQAMMQLNAPPVISDGPALEPKTITVSAYVSAKFVSKSDDADGMDTAA